MTRVRGNIEVTIATGGRVREVCAKPKRRGPVNTPWTVAEGRHLGEGGIFSRGMQGVFQGQCSYTRERLALVQM
jgi:hypothetical protein